MNARGIGIFLIAAVALLGGTTPDAAAPAAKPNVRNLLQQALDPEFVAGREVLVDLVEIPPNGVLERHWHPGEEFHYYLEGDARVEIEGQPPIEGKPGTVGHVPFKAKHRAMAGPQGAKVLVFRVHTQGQPWRYPAESAQAHVHP
jgi:quercetin dioxygenase-like cupin family protein